MEENKCCCDASVVCGCSCDCSCNCSIKILGSGCARCNSLEKVVVEALNELGIQEGVCHVTDFSEIASYGVIMTPALVIDDNVVLYGKVPSIQEMKEIIQKSRG